MTTRNNAVRCRPLGREDVPEILDLLGRGFPERPRSYWERGLARLRDHAAAMGTTSLGQVLVMEQRVVGVLLWIFSTDAAAGTARCNVSSWYADPECRGFAPLLLSRGARDPAVTYFNISPARQTRPIIEAQGFRRYGTGRFWTLAWLGRRRHARVIRLASTPMIAERFRGPERALLIDHLSWGCTAVAVETDRGPEPFVFQSNRVKGVVPGVRLVYCRDVRSFVEFAGPVGRWLLRRGSVVVAVDCDGKVPDLAGIFVSDKVPKYFKGPVVPRVGDLSYTELVMFGP